LQREAKGKILTLLAFCLFLSGTTGASVPAGLKLSFQSPALKVFLDEPSPGRRGTWEVRVARGEYESFQLLVVSQGEYLRDVRVEVAPPTSAAATHKGAGLEVEVRLVGYVETRPDDPRPWGAAQEIGWWPDPLLPNRPFDVAVGETQPVWITLFAPLGTPQGKYTGKISVKTGSGRTARGTYQVEVFDVDLPKRPHLQNTAFMPAGNLNAHYQVSDGLGGRPFLQLYERWASFAFQHHLGPAFDMLMGWNQTEVRESLEAGSLGPTSDMLAPALGQESHVTWPIHRGPEGYDFRAAQELIDLGLEYGMNRFCIAIFDHQQHWEQQSEKTRAAMADLLRAYIAMLRTRGLAKAAFVYNADEPGPDMWETVKKNFEFIRSIDPELKAWLCLNEVKGVSALAGYTDIWDVYIRQYEASGVEERRRAGEAVVWGVCVWPHEHPNLFIEYPAMDARIMGWLTYIYRISGFEYWGLNQWGINTGRKDWAPFVEGTTRTRWQRTRWPLGDGWLLYPGPQGEPLSSIRFENLRDGFEDAELLLMLDSRGKEAEARCIARRVARTPEDFTSDPRVAESAHEALLRALSTSMD